MKAKITLKEAKRLHAYCFGYCEIQHMLHLETPIFYTCNAYGRRADFYKLEDPRNGNTVRVSTGYGPTGDRYINYEIYRKREKRSHTIDYDGWYDQRIKLRILFFDMLKDANENIRKA